MSSGEGALYEYLICWQRLCIHFSVSRANYLTHCVHTWTLLVPVIFGPIEFNADVNYSFIHLVKR